MTTKEKLALLLEQSQESFVSGGDIAARLGITRSAIWKNIHQLEDEGYVIEAVTNRGYRLAADNDVVNTITVERNLCKDCAFVKVVPSVTSTNDVLKENADRLPEWSCIVAGNQKSGRGRSGRSFYSPSESGVYLSILLRPQIAAEQATKITTIAAVAACRTIEKCTGKDPAIKWVNDVFIDGKKVCGILTEASLNIENGLLDWAIMGIGFNVYEPEGGFPEELKDIAGAIAEKKEKDLRARIACEFISCFKELCLDMESLKFAEEYKRRSFLIGKKINVLRPDGKVPAVAVDVDEQCRLKVRYLNGMEETLSSGEVSVREIK